MSLPPQVSAYVESLPGPYVGDRWGIFISPIGVPLIIKCGAWGQIATPEARADLWDSGDTALPFDGRGWFYVAWLIKPDGGKPNFPTFGWVMDWYRSVYDDYYGKRVKACNWCADENGRRLLLESIKDAARQEAQHAK